MYAVTDNYDQPWKAKVLITRKGSQVQVLYGPPNFGHKGWVVNAGARQLSRCISNSVSNATYGFGSATRRAVLQPCTGGWRDEWV